MKYVWKVFVGCIFTYFVLKVLGGAWDFVKALLILFFLLLKRGNLMAWLVFLLLLRWGYRSHLKGTNKVKPKKYKDLRKVIREDVEEPTLKEKDYFGTSKTHTKLYETSYSDRADYVNSGLFNIQKSNKPLFEYIDEFQFTKYCPIKKDNEALMYYNKDYGLEIMVRLPQNSCFSATDEGYFRDDVKRKMLKPWVKPMGMMYDRTHIIPWGYHGVENDPALVVGWDSEQNRKLLRDVEISINEKNKNHPMVWYSRVQPLSYGARLTYIVRSLSNNSRLETFSVEVGTPEKPVPFYWSYK